MKLFVIALKRKFKKGDYKVGIGKLKIKTLVVNVSKTRSLKGLLI